MQLTFPCPYCGKEYDLPWSMSGKKARCKRCSHDFVIPAPFEPTGPQSSEAIPVSDPTETQRSPAGTRPIRAQDPLPPELLAALRTGTVARTTKIEVPTATQPPSARTVRNEVPPPEPPEAMTDEADDPPWPHHVKARDALAPQSPLSALEPSARPAWLIPAIAGGGVALLLAINIGFYLAFFGGAGKTDRVERDQPVPADSAGTVSEASANATEATAAP